jgi:hypothetical protein
MIFAAGLTVLFMVITGLALYRRLAVYLLASRLAEFSEIDLLLLGVLPGLALVGAMLDFTALFHLLRIEFLFPLFAGLLLVLRRDLLAMLAALRSEMAGWFVQVRRGNFFPALAASAGCGVLLLGLLLSQVPAGNVDVWVFHIPLAQSFVDNHGFVFPQWSNVFYSNQPLQFELLFAAVMLAVRNFAAAGAVNVAIFLGFILLVLSFARRARYLQFIVVCYVFVCSEYFLLDAATPMIDLPRSCISVASYLFAYRYACNFRRFDLVMSALLAGMAVAGKYTELLTPLVIVISLLPFIATKRERWIDLIIAMAAFVGVSGYWYAKNAILFGNPIFPFLFGHPGITDDWMASYLHMMLIPFDPADRIYSTNLATLKGWYDFAFILLHRLNFLWSYVVIIAISLALPLQRRWLLPMWCFVLFSFWYAIMFNAMRWVVPAVLLTLATAFIVWASVADYIVEQWKPQWPTTAIGAAANALKRHSGRWIAVTSMGLAVVLLLGLVRAGEGRGHFMDVLLPQGVNRELVAALIYPGKLDAYLAAHRPGYALYRYIGDHNLAHVLQSFDDGGTQYASAYNGGHSNDWVLPYRDLPASAADTDDFIKKNGIHYFVDRQPISSVDLETFGPDNVLLAKAVIARLKTHARLIAKFDQGMSLYEIMRQDGGTYGASRSSKRSAD